MKRDYAIIRLRRFFVTTWIFGWSLSMDHFSTAAYTKIGRARDRWHTSIEKERLYWPS
jgi:hypothetical protein